MGVRLVGRGHGWRLVRPSAQPAPSRRGQLLGPVGALVQGADAGRALPVQAARPAQRHRRRRRLRLRNDLPCSLAWEAFGEGNGAASLPQMRARIAKYRDADASDRSDFAIGCRILTQPFFLPEHRWIPVPESWAPNIVSFKRYSTDDPAGLRLWEAVQNGVEPSTQAGFAEEQARYGEPTLVRPRLGQGAFRSW